MTVELHGIFGRGSTLGVVSVVALVVVVGLLKPQVLLLFLALRRCGFNRIDIDRIIVMVLVSLLWPQRLTRLGSLGFGLRSEIYVCSAVFLHDLM